MAEQKNTLTNLYPKKNNPLCAFSPDMDTAFFLKRTEEEEEEEIMTNLAAMSAAVSPVSSSKRR